MGLVAWLKSLFSGPAPEEATQRAWEEKRKTIRAKVELRVEMWFENVDQVVDSRTIDISRGGAFIHTRRPRPEGTEVRLQLIIGGASHEITGVVVRQVLPAEDEGQPGNGIFFHDVDPETAALIEEVVRRSPPA